MHSLRSTIVQKYEMISSNAWLWRVTVCTTVVLFCFKNSAYSLFTHQGQKWESSFISKSSSFHQRASDPDGYSLGLETVSCSIKIQYFNSIYTLQISHLPSKLTFTSFRKKNLNKPPQKRIMEHNSGKHSSWMHPPGRAKVRKMECDKCGYWLSLAVKVNKNLPNTSYTLNMAKKVKVNGCQDRHSAS